VAQSQVDEVGVQIAGIAAELLRRDDEIAAVIVERICAAVPLYDTESVVSREQLHQTSLANLHAIFEPMGRTPVTSSPESRENGRRRARAGVPLTAVLEAYRVGARCMWDHLAEIAARPAVAANVMGRAASEMWQVLDIFSQEMAEGYRDELTAQVVVQEEGRSTLVQALLEGRIDDVNLWEAADTLRLSPRGPYVVVAAQVPVIGRHAFPRIETALDGLGIRSAWRLQYDVEVGIACLPRPESQLDRLASALAERSEGCLGISPPYDDLRTTRQALQRARIALRGAYSGQRVVFFDRSPLAVAAAGTPEVMERLAATIFSGLDALAPAERSTLLDTFGVWLDSKGSAQRTAELLFCHPNTIRHRIRRLERHTGRSTADPRALAELALAFEVTRRTT
jgi:hypothetical protein